MESFIDDIAKALGNNEELETKYGDGDHGNFLSGWQCTNPFASEMLERVLTKTRDVDFVKYSYMEYEDAVTQKINAFHKGIGEPDQELIFPSSCGSTSIIFSFCAQLSIAGIDEVYYIPPIYFSMHYALKMFRIKARPISGQHIYEDDFRINLPEKKTVLLFVDPLWFAGRHVPEHVIDDIISWQGRTGSTVFVDGSFQYMPWSGDRHEATSRLDPSKTTRMICPTKIMAIHGYRFSYALMPKKGREEFFHTFTNIYASSATANIVFANEAIEEMASGNVTRNVISKAKRRYHAVIRAKKIETLIAPDCGYFTFAKINHKLPEGYKLMTQEFFEQKRYGGYAKVNLVSPSFHLLDPG